MVRRSLGALLWTLVGVLACFLGGLSALVGTPAGRALLARVLQTTLQGAVAGQVELGGASGSLLRGLVLTDLKLYDRDSSLVAWLPRAELDYSLLDFAAGRVVLMAVRLDRPYLNIVQHRHGRLNIEELLRLGEPSASPRSRQPLVPRPKPLIVLRNVDITDGDLVLRLQSSETPGDSLLEIDAFESDGRRRIRRFEDINGHIDAFRISAPGQRGLRVDLGTLAVRISDPPVELTDARGRVSIDGDSLEADLPVVGLPASRLSLRGRLAWPRGPLLYNLDIGADSVTLADMRFIDPRFPEGAVLRGALAVRSHGERLLEVRLDTFDLAYHGGRALGRATAFVAADSGLVALRGADITADDLDLTLPHAFLDTLPFYGHLTGRTRADGRLSALTLDLDWMFRDSLVPEWPESRVRGRGLVDLVAPAGITFGLFDVDTTTLAFGTVARLLPAASLHGTLTATGTLTGSLTNLTFNGTLRHLDGERPASVLRGRFAADSRRDTLALDVDAQLDTLSFDGLQGSFPSLGLEGGVTGTARFTGRVDSLGTQLDLMRLGGGGRLQANGALVLLPDRRGARGLQLTATNIALERWVSEAPPSRLNATVITTMDADTSGSAPVGSVAVRLAPSSLAGAALDSGVVMLRAADGLVHFDTLWLRQPGVATDGAGTLGWRRPARGEALITFDVTNLGSLDSLVAWTGGAWGDSVRAVLASGTGRLNLRASGALDSIALDGFGTGSDLAIGDWRVPEVRLRGAYEPGPRPIVWLEAAADSLAHGQRGFGAASAAVRGWTDSLGWFARSRIGDLSGFLAGGRFARDSAGQGVVGFDSLAVRLPGGVWFLESPARLAFDDSTLTVSRMGLRRVNGPGRIEVEGTVPTAGTGRADSAKLHVEGFPLVGVYALLQQDTLGAEGDVALDLALRGSRRDPVYEGRFAVMPEKEAAPSLDGTVAYAGRRLDATAYLRRNGLEIVALTAHLPLDLALVPVAKRQLSDTLAIRARADAADLATLEAFTAALRDVQGQVTADVAVRGTWDAPRLDGTMRVDSGGVSIAALGVRWSNIAGRLRLSGDTLRVDSLAIHSEHGQADLSGYVRLERLTRPVLALDINARDFKALEIRGDLSITATARLALSGPVFGATLTGTGTVTSGVLYFADLVTKRVIDLDAPDPALAALIDTSLAALIRRQGLGPSFHNVFLDSLRIRDLQLAMGNSMWLRSNEANIQLTGRLNVNKVNRNFLLTGNLQAPRGTYRLLVGPVTREFVVTQGSVRYFGTPDLDAGLDIEARHVVRPVSTTTQTTKVCGGKDENVTVVAHIGGTLYVPRLTLQAQECDMPQTDIISYLMFGQPSADIASGTPGVATGRSALLSSTVSSIISGAISGELERTVVSDLGIPLDYVEIRPGDPGSPWMGASFAAGWQVGQKTFFIVRASLCPGANQLGASLQFRISPEWRTEASVEPVRSCPNDVPGTGNSQRQVGGDLFWERRY
ncbi:MAG: translocation/assembly module TamB domain-containing protein [Gemmatimonadales bacterium]